MVKTAAFANKFETLRLVMVPVGENKEPVTFTKPMVEVPMMLEPIVPEPKAYSVLETLVKVALV